MSSPVRFQRGETIRLAILCAGAIDSDLDIVSTVTAVAKAAGRGAVVPPADAPIVATFDVDRVAASVGSDPGWMLTLTSYQTATMAPGVYVTNGVLTLVAGDVEKTTPLFFAIEESTS